MLHFDFFLGNKITALSHSPTELEVATPSLKSNAILDATALGN